MKWLRYCIVMLSFIIFSPVSHAGQDPIGWTLSGSIPAQTVANLTYPTSLVYTFTNNLPFEMVTPLYIQIKANPSSEFPVAADNCSGKRLAAAGAAGSTCTVTVGFTPTTVGTKTLQLFEEYGRNVVPLPMLTSNTTTGPSELLTGTVTIALPGAMAAATSAPFQFTYTNNNNGTVTGVVSPTSNITINPNAGGGTLSGLSTTCPAATNLAPTQSCVVNGTFTTGVQGNYKINDFISYNGSAGTTATTSLSTSTNAIVGAVTTPLPLGMGAGEQQPVLFTFTNGGSQAVTPSSVIFTPLGGTVTPSSDTCSNQTIPGGGQCTVSIIFNSLTPQTYSVFATLTYAGGTVNTPVTPSSASTSVVKVTGVVTTPLPTVMLPGDSASILFTYTNGGTGTIYNVTAPSFVNLNGTFVPDTATSTCGNTSTIVSMGSCTYAGTFTAGAASPAGYAVTASFNYAGGMNVVPKTTTSVPPTFLGTTTTSLPSPMGAGERDPFTFTFTNQSAASFHIPVAAVTVTASGGTTTSTDNCSGVTVGSGGSCTVTGVFSSGVPGDYSVSASLAYSPPSGVATASTSSTGTVLVQGVITNAFPPYIPPLTMGTGEQHSVTFTYTNTGPGTAYGINTPIGSASLIVSPNGSCLGGATSTGTCTSGTLASGMSCTVTCNFEPTAPAPGSPSATSTITSSLTYAGGSASTTPSPMTTLAITQANVVAGSLVAFPTATDNNSSYPFVITFTNNGTGAVYGGTAAPVLSISPGPQAVLQNPSAMPGTIPTSSASCTTVPLPAGQSCTVSGTYNPTVAGTVFTFNAYWMYAAGTVSQPPVTSTNTFARKLTINNYCGTDVWFSFNGAESRKGCSDKNPCAKGSICNKHADEGKGICYFVNPIPAKGGLHLGPMTQLKPTTTDVLVPDMDAKNNTIWSGSIAGRTGCVGTSCETADCNSSGGDKTCPPGNNFTLPTTLAELTLMRGVEDKYSIQAGNGINLSVSMGPTHPDKTTPAYSANHPNYCATPGSADASRIFNACSWTLKPPAYPNAASAINYVWVQPGVGGACTQACSGAEVCGLSFEKGRFAQVCGKQMGYWTANQACLLNAVDASTYFDCKSAMTQPAGDVLQDLNACTKVSSQETSPQTCVKAGNREKAAMVQWIKSACPSVSAYAGDANANFTCKTDAIASKSKTTSKIKVNVTEYTISFCPEMAPTSPFRTLRGTASNP